MVDWKRALTYVSVGLLLVFQHYLFTTYISDNTLVQALFYIPLYTILIVAYMVYNDISIQYILGPIIFAVTLLYLVMFYYMQAESYLCTGKKTDTKYFWQALLLFFVLIYIIQNGKCGTTKVFMILIFVTVVQVIYDMYYSKKAKEEDKKK